MKEESNLALQREHYYLRLFCIIILAILIVYYVYMRARISSLHDFEKAKSIHVFLDHPSGMEHLDLEGNLSIEGWRNISLYLSREDYPDTVLKWQALAIVKFKLEDGKSEFIVIYNTKRDIGCYRYKDKYYKVYNEKEFRDSLSYMLSSNEN